jgi:hypothetical protein
MPASDVLSVHEVLRLAPMLFGRIRWRKSLGSPVGDPTTGFRVLVAEHTVSQFRMGQHGPEVIPGTGIWKAPFSVPCVAAPDEDETHVVAFNVPDVKLSGFPDGGYRVHVELTGNWGVSPYQVILGSRRIDPIAYRVSLTKDRHLVGLDFDVLQEPWHFRQ